MLTAISPLLPPSKTTTRNKESNKQIHCIEEIKFNQPKKNNENR